jgi:cytoskeletal protein RodZ
VEQSSTQTVATFTGTLLRREKHPAKQLVQLVFREDGKNWLCLSSNPATARLDVGKNYRIEGAFKQLGHHPFIHEPSISLVKQRSIALIVGISVGAIILLAGGTVGAFALMSNHGQPQQSTSTNAAPQATPMTQQSSTATVTETPTDPPVTTPAATTTTPTTTTKKKTTTSNTTPTPQVTAPVTTQPTTPDQTQQTPTVPPTEDPVTPDPGQGTPPDPNSSDPSAPDPTT